MPPKRKAVGPPKGTPPSNRPRTRSSGPLPEEQLVKPSPKKHTRKGPPGIPASEFLKAVAPSSSSKEKEISKSKHTSSPDELDLLGSSPNKEMTGHVTPRASTPGSSATKSTPRKSGQIMEVVITTPKSLSRIPQNISSFAASSPSPSNRACNGTLIPTPSRENRIQTEKRSPPSSPASDGPSTSSRAPSPLASDTSPTKPAAANKALPRFVPSHLEPYLRSQKSAILQALQRPPLFIEDDNATSSSVFNQLSELLNGTTQRNEGNSCLVLGPRGCGKTRLVDRVLESLPSTSTSSPVIIRLSAHCQTNDRLAMREIARQVHQQLGSGSSLPSLPSREPEEEPEAEDGRADVDLPPPSHLPTLISALPTLGRPVIIVLDAFDGFAAHARQALLYCLLDTVQSCRGGAPAAPAEHEIVDPLTDSAVSQADGDIVPPEGDLEKRHEPEAAPRETVNGEHGLLVIGVTSRVDCLTLLEKRVKSRFSHRVMRVRTLAGLDDFLRFAKGILGVDPRVLGEADEEWKMLWMLSVEKFLADKSVHKVFKETFAFVKDLRVPCRLLTSPVLELTPSSPWLSAMHLLASVSTQRSPKRFPFLSSLPYPHIALLIAAAHARTSGQDTFNFEMLYDAFAAQVRTSAAAPVQIAGGAIGMVKVSRGVMAGAFEHLVATRVLQPVAAPATHITREFVRYRCVAERDEIKAAVDHLGQTNLKRWFFKAQ